MKPQRRDSVQAACPDLGCCGGVDEVRMDNTVAVVIPIGAEAAKALESPVVGEPQATT